MESAEQPTKDLHANVGEEIKKMGHNVSTVPPHEEPVLKGDDDDLSMRDVTHSAKVFLEEMTSGEGQSSRVRTAPAKNPISIAFEKARRKFAQKKAA